MKYAVWPSSLRGRLLLGTLVWIVLSVSVAGFGLYRLFQDHVYRQFVTTLQHHADQIMADLNLDDIHNLALQSRLSNPLFEQPYSGFYWQVAVQDKQGWQIALRSTSLWDDALPMNIGPLGVRAKQIVGPDGHRLMALTQELEGLEDGDKHLRITVAGDMRLVAEPLERFHRIVLWSLGALALGLMIAAIWQVFLSLSPLRILRARLTEVREGDAQQIEGRFPSEIQPLVEDFNAVLQANAHIVERARAQAGNLAHAIKTPLTILANAAQDQHSDLAVLVHEQVGLARRHADHHLSRARATAVRALGVRTPIYPALTALCRVLGKLYVDKQIHIEQADEQLMFKGEEQDLQEMVGNLLDNACKWANQHVWCTVKMVASDIQIVVQDDGPGLEEQYLKTIFLRGQRADERHPGFGLGLDIVSELAASYGGSLTASRSELGGLRMTLTIQAV